MHLNRKADAEEEHGTQPHAPESQSAEKEPEGIEESGVKNPGDRLGVRGAPERAKAPVKGDAHAEAEEGRKSGAPEKPAPKGVKADKVQENGDCSGPEDAIRRVPVIREPVRHAHEEVRDAGIKGVGRIEGIAPGETGTEPGRQYLRVVLQVAVHAYAVRQNQFGTREGGQTEKGGTENKDAVSRTDAHQIYLPEKYGSCSGRGKEQPACTAVQVEILSLCCQTKNGQERPKTRDTRLYLFLEGFPPGKQASALICSQGNRTGRLPGKTENSPAGPGRQFRKPESFSLLKRENRGEGGFRGWQQSTGWSCRGPC